MRELFLQIVNMSLTALWLILAVMLVRLLLHRAPKWISVLLWGIVALRLICPFSMESPFSLIPETPAITASFLPGLNAGGKEPAMAENLAGKNTLSDEENVNPPAPSDKQAGIYYSQGSTPKDENFPPMVDILAGIWLAGFLLLIGYSVFSWLRLKNRVKTTVLLRNHIFQSERISSPFVFGIVKPGIYLPYGMDENSLEYVIAHEEAHLQRRDHWWKLLGVLLLSIHWFNPLVWLSYVLFCRDIELACDEKVIKGLDRNQRADYSQALLNCSTTHRSIAACPPAFGEIGVKERVKSILSYKRPAFWMTLGAVAACIVLAFCFLTDPASHQTLTWAQALSPEDVQSVRLELLAGSGTQSLAGELSPERIPSMTALLNEGRGKYVSQTADNWGGATYLFHIILQDGSSHTAGNAGNRYLMIDGDFYEAPHEYLASWEDTFPEFGELFRIAQNGDSSGQAPASNGKYPDETSGTPPTGNDENLQEAAGQSPANNGENSADASGTASVGKEELTGAETAQPTNDNDLFDAIILNNVDLDHDGETESIRVYEEIKGELYHLEVIRQDGTVIWDREAGSPHMGWTSIFLSPYDGKDYLMEYLPTIYQGVASYRYTRFSLEGGQVTEINSRTADFSLPVLELTGEMKTFGELANYWLANSTVLLSTLEFQTVIGPADPTEIPEIYPVVFDSGEPDNYFQYPALPEKGLPEDVLPLEFMFASGAGAWSTELTLYPDGSFEGIYSDSDAESSPEYPNGTTHICKFMGKFGEITKLNDYSCSMRLEELVCETEADTEWIEDGVRYIGTDAYGLAEGEEFIFYMPFAPAAALDEEFLNWWPERILYRDGSIQTLFTYAIRNVNTKEGFFASWWN